MREYGRWCLPEESIFEGSWSISEKKDGKFVVYIRWINSSGSLTTIYILQMPELIHSPFMANVCCPSEEFIIATASSCSWRVVCISCISNIVTVFQENYFGSRWICIPITRKEISCTVETQESRNNKIDKVSRLVLLYGLFLAVMIQKVW